MSDFKIILEFATWHFAYSLLHSWSKYLSTFGVESWKQPC